MSEELMAETLLFTKIVRGHCLVESALFPDPSV